MPHGEWSRERKAAMPLEEQYNQQHHGDRTLYCVNTPCTREMKYPPKPGTQFQCPLCDQWYAVQQSGYAKPYQNALTAAELNALGKV